MFPQELCSCQALSLNIQRLVQMKIQLESQGGVNFCVATGASLHYVSLCGRETALNVIVRLALANTNSCE